MKDTAPDCTTNTQYESLSNKAAIAPLTDNDVVQLSVGEYKRLVAGQFDYAELEALKEACLAMARHSKEKREFASWLLLAERVKDKQEL